MTNGHLAILRSALKVFDNLVIAVGIHPSKPGFLERSERLGVINDVVSAENVRDRVRIREFSSLLVDLAGEVGATAIVRGVRDGTDLDYEMQMIGMNGTMAPDVPTVLFPATPETRHVTATLVRQIAAMGGDVAPFVPPATLAALARRAT